MQAASPSTRGSPDSQSPPGGVELREDVPLTPSGSGGGARLCAGGPRFIVASFAALTAATTLALLTQIYYGDYEVVPHGSVSSDAKSCSGAGTEALKAGGRSMDAAVAAALCLAVVAPHRTSLDASGTLLYWEYREWRRSAAWLAEWGGTGVRRGAAPRLLVALAALHAQYGRLPWSQLLQPAVDLARRGPDASVGVGAARGGGPGAPARALLADYLESLQHNTSAELSSAWSSESDLRVSSPAAVRAGGWRVWAGVRARGQSHARSSRDSPRRPQMLTTRRAEW